MFNKAFLIGRLVRDPEMRVTPSGITVTRFTIAVDKTFKRDEQNTADFLRIVTWRRLAEICGQYLKKGKLVAVEGRLQIDSYEKDGQRRTSAEVVADNIQMLDKVGASSSEESMAPLAEHEF
jgi:single-strand DNA-binding protein